MAYAIYKRLLRLYPREFRVRLQESMEQTFNDLYNERKQQGQHERLGFILWTFIETGTGVAREHVLLLTEGVTMKTMLANPRWAPVISFMLGVFPFMILEWATRSNLPRSNASPMLWVFLWVLSTGFIAILMLMIRNVRAGNGILARPVSLLFRFIVFVACAWLWMALVIDQWPCFLGGSGC